MNCKLVYSDTNSLLYSIKMPDLDKVLDGNSVLKKHSDFEIFAPSYPLFNGITRMNRIKIETKEMEDI